MPRRKPDGKSVIVSRIELGDFERRQLEDLKFVMMTPALAVGAVGLGIAAAGLFIGNTLSDIKQFWNEGKEEMWGLGHSDEAIQSSTTDNPADLNDMQTPNIDPDEFPGIPDFTDLSPASIYEAIYDARARVQFWSMNEWLEHEGLQSTPFNRTRFNEGATGILKTRPRADIRVTGENEISIFTYQMAIRETAARRNQGRAGSTVAGLLTGWGVIASEAVWRLGNALGIGHASEWTSGDVTAAPGYISDPILDWVRTIVDFPGTDAGHFGTYEYDGMFSTRSDNIYNIANRSYIEDILKLDSSISNDLNIDGVGQHLAQFWPNV